MRIVSYIKDSFQEYEGYHSLVLFSQGCNFHCSYCYNYNEVINPERTEDVFEVMNRELNPLHDAVVFLGGEPTIWEWDLFEAASFVKNKGLKTKVYTNGTNPLLIESMIENNLIDALSIDLKTVGADLHLLTGSSANIEDHLFNFETMLDTFKDMGELEVRTTIYEGLDLEAVKQYMKEKFPDVKHIITKDFRKNI